MHNVAAFAADRLPNSFIVSDFHRLLLAGLPAHYDSNLNNTETRKASLSASPMFHQTMHVTANN
jgi:hypothetical protein